MIKRKVFIVKGYSKTDLEKKFDEYFVKSYSDYFQLSAGGAYSSDEVIFLSEPNHKYLEAKLSEQNLDYGIVVYIGHGANQDDNQIFQLNATEIIKPGQFTLASEKQIIILESCRVLAESISIVDLSDKIPAFEKGGIVRHPLSKEQSREIYDSHINRCERGMMICYACKLGNEAYNFIFSQAIIQNAINWHLDSSRHCAILPIDELMLFAWANTIITSGELGLRQMPQSIGNINFPIAVSKF